MGDDVRNANPEQLECLADLLWTPPHGGAYSVFTTLLTRAGTLDVSGEFIRLRPLLDWLTQTADSLRESAGLLRADDPPPPTQPTSTAVLTTSSGGTSTYEPPTSRRSTYEPPTSPLPGDDWWTGPAPWPGQLIDPDDPHFWTGPALWPGSPFDPDEPDFWTGPEPSPWPPSLDEPDFWTGPALWPGSSLVLVGEQPWREPVVCTGFVPGEG